MKLFRAHLAELRPHLVARGLEVGSTVRQPLAGQILALASQGFVLAKGLDRRVAGATAREVKETVESLVGKRVLLRVVRESGPGFSPAVEQVLDHDEIQALLRKTLKLQKLLKSAASKKGTGLGVLVADVRACVDAWLPDPMMSIGQSKVDSPSNLGGSEALAREIARRVREMRVPTRVPELLRALGVPPEAGKRALLDGASRGLFDLEPESGLGRLSREDAELCPSGPMGTRLSWVRVREQQGAHS
jgi:hypothetical protein